MNKGAEEILNNLVESKSSLKRKTQSRMVTTK